ncbi:MAG: purine-nucleoside phosphorylase [Lachnospiraceae bacterium]|jgi:purine-nucleoside phosphorylase
MVPTPHIAAEKKDIAKVVIMPGDPLRSRWMATHFLENPRLVNDLRGVQGYTGKWNGKDVTVMASGMGIPSMGLYAYELFNFYGVDLIIRTGTAGSIRPDVNVMDVIIADTAPTNSSFLNQLSLPADYIPAADKGTLRKAVTIAENVIAKYKGKRNLHVGPVLTQEIYYSMEENIVENWAKKGILAFEMEAAALYANAAQAGKKALSLFTVSNNILDGSEMDPKLRETSLVDMTIIALRTANE